MKTSIIILTHNQLNFTKRCIESIRLHTASSYEIIVVDNASTDDSIKYLQEQKDIKVLYNNENLGYAKGNNQGLELATGDIILFLNNDVVVTAGWLEPLIHTLSSNEKIAMAGPVTNNISGLQKIPVNYNEETLEGLDSFSLEHCNQNRQRSKKVLRLVGFALACKRKVLDEIGPFDEVFGMGNFEDDDLCLRALSKGYELRIVHDSYIHHYGSATFKNSSVEYSSLLKKNHSILNEKWGFNISYYMFPRPEVVNLIPKNVKRVLEIGCGMGATAIELKERYPCEVYGIEIEQKAFEFATYSTDGVYLADIENFDLSRDYLGEFDCIICADVLEHLRDPWNVVQRLNKLLSQDGYMIISIPNAANLEVVVGLLQGDFTYKEAGILDRTHLRFFTRKTLPTLFPEDLKIEEIHSTTLNYSETEVQFVEYLKRLGKKTGLDTENLNIDAFTYQFLIKAKKMKSNSRR
jgi:O-antigen biosynthesis protein